MTVCYCHTEIGDGDRCVTVTYEVAWGVNDIREDAPPKTQAFCSFGCVKKWATDRAASHDGQVLR